MWWPAVWNSACITVRPSQQFYRLNININGQTVFQSEDIDEDFLNSSKARIKVNSHYRNVKHKKKTICSTLILQKRISLMNAAPMETSHHGAFTDVNIWDRILSEQEQSDWMFCKTETGGNVVSWESAQLNITGLNTDFLNREETCPGAQNITRIMAFNTKLNLLDSIREAFIRKTSVK